MFTVILRRGRWWKPGIYGAHMPLFSEQTRPAVSASGIDVVVESVPSAKLHTRAVQQAIDTCSERGGGRVVLRPGCYRCGTLFLRDGVDLHLEKNALLCGSEAIEDYEARSFEGAARINNGVATALIFAEKAADIAITGEGILDGSGETFWEKNENPPAWVAEKKPLGLWFPALETRAKPRPRALVLLVACEGVRIENVSLRNSPAWTMHLLACSQVLIRGINLRGSVHGSNTDGIDLDACCDVRVEDCDIETGDDALCLKNTNMWGLRRTSRHITVRRCRLASVTHGFTIGTETQADFEDITLTDSTIEKADGWRTLTGIGLSILDGGAIRRVHIENVTISDSIAPVQLRLGNAGRGQIVPTPGSITGITMERITILRAHGNCLIAGLPGHPLRDIALRDVSLEFVDVTDPARIMAQLPEFDTEFPPGEVWRFLPAHGFYCRYVEGLEFNGVTITNAVPDRRPALTLKSIVGWDGRGVTLTEVTR